MNFIQVIPSPPPIILPTPPSSATNYARPTDPRQRAEDAMVSRKVKQACGGGTCYLKSGPFRLTIARKKSGSVSLMLFPRPLTLPGVNTVRVEGDGYVRQWQCETTASGVGCGEDFAHHNTKLPTPTSPKANPEGFDRALTALLRGKLRISIDGRPISAVEMKTAVQAILDSGSLEKTELNSVEEFDAQTN